MKKVLIEFLIFAATLIVAAVLLNHKLIFNLIFSSV